MLAELRSLVVKGIPTAWRCAVWLELSGAAARSEQFPPDFYSRIADLGPSPEVMAEITKDIDRTFPGHVYFDSVKTMQGLRRLLGAVAFRNPDIGYCQSLNFVAGVVFLFTRSEEAAFWILDVVINEIMPPDYYTAALVGAHTDQRVLTTLLRKHVPEVVMVFEEMELGTSVATLEWFMAVFSTRLPTHTAFRVWDVFVLVGTEALFKVSLALFEAKRPKFAKCRGDLATLFDVLQRQLCDWHDSDTLMEAAFESKKVKWRSLSAAELEPLRLSERTAVLSELHVLNELRARAAASEGEV